MDRGNSYKSWRSAGSSLDYITHQPAPVTVSEKWPSNYLHDELDISRTVRSDEYERSVEVIKGGHLELHDDDEDYDDDYDLDEDDSRFVNLALLSNIAV